ncbi:MAG: MOSC domain-containing protein [Acidimicrobiia bacterium]
MDLTLRVIETRVGRPAPLGDRDTESAIAKHPVGVGPIALDDVNLAGDDQADRTVHGGPDKAVYSYPSEHAAGWQADGFAIESGGVGENLVTAGAREHDVRIGDVWRWGDARMQVSQPRAPCFKLSLHTRRKDVAPRMIATGRSGWYLRVLEPAVVDPHGELVLVERDDTAPTVLETFAVMFPGFRPEADDPALVRRVLGCPPLSEEWFAAVVHRNPHASKP